MTVRALDVMRGRYSRDYFLERVEAVDESGVATAFPRFTFGPNRRYGSRGAYMMHYGAPDFTQLAPIENWITRIDNPVPFLGGNLTKPIVLIALV